MQSTKCTHTASLAFSLASCAQLQPAFTQSRTSWDPLQEYSRASHETQSTDLMKIHTKNDSLLMCCNTDGPSWVARTGVTEGVRYLNITDFNFRSYFQNLWRHTNCTISLSKSIWRLGEYTEKHHLGWLSSCALSWALAFGWCWGLDLGNQIHQHFSYLFWQRFSSACKSVGASGRSKLAMKVLCHT